MSEQKKLVEIEHLKQYFPAGGFGKNRKAAKDNALNGNDLLNSLLSFMK